jgi:hypothetical protein
MMIPTTFLKRASQAREAVGRTGYHGIEREEHVKPLRWTAHALQMLADRGIDLVEVERAIAAPEHVVGDPPQREVLMRRYFDDPLEREMLLRVVVEDTLEERVVVTVYKTSQIARYLQRIVP